MAFEKLIRDGQVAVLYTNNYGVGWYSWSCPRELGLLFDRELVELVLADRRDDAAKLAEVKYPGTYTGGRRTSP